MDLTWVNILWLTINDVGQRDAENKESKRKGEKITDEEANQDMPPHSWTARDQKVNESFQEPHPTKVYSRT